MNFKSVDYIVSAKHYGGSARGYIRRMQQDIHRRGIPVTIKDLDGEPTGVPVVARVWQGQWIAECECRGACFVDPEEPVFFCFGCGNRANGQKPRPVIFPEDWKAIEQVLLERPVDDLAGLTDLERAGMAKPVLFVEVEISVRPDIQRVAQALRTGAPIPADEKRIQHLPLVRSWEPGETVEQLRSQQDAPIRKWRKEIAGGGPSSALRSAQDGGGHGI